MTDLTQRERRLIALAILIGLFAGLYLFLISPILTGFVERETERAALVSSYSRNERIIASMRHWRREAERQKQTMNRYALIATSRTEAIEMIREQIIHQFVKIGGEVRAFQEVEAPTGWVRARLDVKLDMPEIEQGLRNLQNQIPYAIVQSITVSGGSAAVATPSQNLDVKIEISAPYSNSKARQ